MYEEEFKSVMTVREFYKYVSLGTKLKIKSGFNGKILCNEYNPRLHDKKYGDRIITTIWVEIKTLSSVYDNLAKPILVCFVNGEIEYRERINNLESKGE